MGKLDREEQALLGDFERGKLKPVKHRKAELARHREAAEATFKKDV